MMKSAIGAIFLGATLLRATPGGAQTAAPAIPVAAPSPAILPRVVIDSGALAGLPRRTVTVPAENGGSATYSGVDVGALLEKYGAPHGPALRGKAVADYVLATATDGYRVVFALAELDPALTDAVVLLADQRDGAPLDAKYGPFQIIVPAEKHHVRWIRNVREIDVIAAP